MSVVTTILICSLVLATNTRGSEIIWREGKRYEICVRDDGTYLVTVNGELWLASSPIVNRIFANGNWNQLKLAGKEQQNGSTPGLGQFSAISLSLQTAGSDSIRLVNTIKYYTKHDLFLFETSFPQRVTGMAQDKPGETTINKSNRKVGNRVGEFWSTTTASTFFPAFDFSNTSKLHSLGYAEWHGRFSSDSNSYGVGLKSFKGGTEGGPVVLFNTTGEVARNQSDAIVISSFNNFKHAIATKVDATPQNAASFVFGLQSYITEVQSGFNISFGLSGSEHGINAAVESWGEKLRARYGTTRISPEFDPTNTKLGYWTDNGAYYDGSYWQQNPTAVAQDVLVDVKMLLDTMGVPISYIQLDPWWYPNGNGCIEWIPKENLFPKGLSWLRETLGIPLLLYANYFSVHNNYVTRKQFDFIDSLDFQLSYARGPIANVEPHQSYQFYDYIMSQYSRSMGAYEVDFLDFQFLLFLELQEQVDAAEIWMKGMTDAALKHNVSVQLCMELPSDLLQSVLFPAITNARASEDDFPTAGNRWDIAMTAMLMRALDIGPFFDDIWTRADQPGNPYNKSSNNIRMRTIISTFSGGPVGISDGRNFTDPELIMQSCRADGVLLKPSKPIVPIDAQFMPVDQGGIPAGNIWNTHSQIGSTMWYYVLAFDVAKQFHVTPSHIYPLKMMTNRPKFMIGEWGFPSCSNYSMATACLHTFDDAHPFALHTGDMNGQEHSFVVYSISPVLSNGYVFLGEFNKLVAVSPNRFTEVSVNGNGVKVKVSGKPSEMLTTWFVKPDGRILTVAAQIPSSGEETIYVA
ncbi:uncharacterized protein LOC134192275 [Corticium candelabrum]|uniref:uncharacterized protein LOC134192275 n=1 Tax=Corticium candelabrum TaxID=121492 RepID=UPI002E25C0AE|nr:uncharacterized protein LOC134192275 [Corticium candelabrum]